MTMGVMEEKRDRGKGGWGLYRRLGEGDRRVCVCTAGTVGPQRQAE